MIKYRDFIKEHLLEFNEFDPYGEDYEDGELIPDDISDEECQKYVGRSVRIRGDSEYYKDGDYNNPIGIEGEIVKAADGFIYVKWSNGIRNTYNTYDLELI